MTKIDEENMILKFRGELCDSNMLTNVANVEHAFPGLGKLIIELAVESYARGIRDARKILDSETGV